MRRGVIAFVTVVGSAAWWGAVVAMPASADVAPGAGANCAYVLQPVDGAGTTGAIDTEPVSVGCYATYAQALAAGSDGSIQVPAGQSPAGLTDAALRADTDADAADNVLIGTEWTNTSYGGASNSYFAASTCTGSTTWQVAYVTDAWNDQFNSGKGFGGCDTNKKFRSSNFAGTVVTCTPNCPDYGALDNQVSSLRWRI
jgi:hypothetical protein